MLSKGQNVEGPSMDDQITPIANLFHGKDLLTNLVQNVVPLWLKKEQRQANMKPVLIKNVDILLNRK